MAPLQTGDSKLCRVGWGALKKQSEFFAFYTRGLQSSSAQGMFPQVFMRENDGGPVIAQIRALRRIARLQEAQSLVYKLIMTAYEHV